MHPRRSLRALLLAVGLGLVLAAPAAATTITVDDVGDEKVADGKCTLREAIWVSNTNFQIEGAEAGDCLAGQSAPARDRIEFDFSNVTTTIEPLSPLPEITGPVEIDGSQTAIAATAVKVEIDGNQVTGGTTVPGLQLHFGSDESWIHNIAVNEFPGDGIQIYSDENLVEYTVAGMNPAGSTDKGNGRNGIMVQGAGTTVALSAASGNVQHGIEISPLGGISDGAGNTIRGSRIGTSRDGSAAIPNEGDGIHLTLNTIEADGDSITIGGSEGLTPGGKCSGDCNLVSGNKGDGIEVRVSGEGAKRTDGLLIQGNLVGTDVEGEAAIANEGDGGLRIWGGVLAARVEDNVISGNTGRGISILAGGSGGIGATDTAITGNTIGLGSDGDTVVANILGGIKIDRSLLGGPAISGTRIGGSEDPTPGGACDGDCNLISGNDQSGILLFNTTAEGGPIAGTEIIGNYLGTDVTGTESRGNGSWGIELSGVSTTTVGKPGSPNVISGNDAIGVQLSSASTTGNTVQSNLIGVAADGTSPLGNGEYGVRTAFGAVHQNTIGGTTAGAGNVIAYNGKAGVALGGGEAPTVDVPILGNSIHSNAGLGIDLLPDLLSTGVTENGGCEEAVYANRCQEFPLLIAAAGEGSSSAITGTLVSDPGKSFRIELFANPAADPSGNGEGERFLGAVEATTDGAGEAGFIFATTTAGLATGEYATATATELNGAEPLSTSEFSDSLAAPVCNVEGGGGVDELSGGAADDVICGFGAGDTIAAGSGRDAVLAGEGDDTIDVADGAADALVDCGPGTDTVTADAEGTDPAAIFVGCETVIRPAVAAEPAPGETGTSPAGSGSAKVYKCKGKRATIVGTSKKETIKGTGKADVIVALGGNDTVKGLGGNDTICGGNGNDTIKAGPGNDVSRGEGGNDKLFGEKGNDRLDGGNGKDTVKGGSGNDRLKGNAGKGDLCDGQSGKKDKLDGKKAGCEKRKRIP